jgi:hypothetical protein
MINKYIYLHTNNTQYTENRTHITIKQLNIYNNQNINLFGKCRLCPVFASYTLAFALQLRKMQEKTSVRVVTRTPQADTAQYKNNEQYNTQKKNSNTE